VPVPLSQHSGYSSSTSVTQVPRQLVDGLVMIFRQSKES
jgi:hypothetical protein